MCGLQTFSGDESIMYELDDIGNIFDLTLKPGLNVRVVNEQLHSAQAGIFLRYFQKNEDIFDQIALTILESSDNVCNKSIPRKYIENSLKNSVGIIVFSVPDITAQKCVMTSFAILSIKNSKDLTKLGEDEPVGYLNILCALQDRLTDDQGKSWSTGFGAMMQYHAGRIFRDIYKLRYMFLHAASISLINYYHMLSFNFGNMEFGVDDMMNWINQNYNSTELRKISDFNSEPYKSERQKIHEYMWKFTYERVQDFLYDHDITNFVEPIYDPNDIYSDLPEEELIELQRKETEYENNIKSKIYEIALSLVNTKKDEYLMHIKLRFDNDDEENEEDEDEEMMDLTRTLQSTFVNVNESLNHLDALKKYSIQQIYHYMGLQQQN